MATVNRDLDKVQAEMTKQERSRLQMQEFRNSAEFSSFCESYRSAPKEEVSCQFGCQSKPLPISNVDRHDMGLPLAICPDCGLIWLTPRPVASWFTEFYEKYYWPIYLGYRYTDTESMIRGERLRERAVELADLITSRRPLPPTRSLDIGSGQGALVEEFAKRWPHADVVGFEPSLQAIEECRARGLNVRQWMGASLSIDKSEPKFDLVTMIHVLEHIQNPLELVKSIQNVLSDDGLVYIEVPDMASPVWKGKGFIHIAHLYYFSPETLSRLLEFAGFEVVEICEAPVSDWKWGVGIFAKKASSPAASNNDRNQYNRARLLSELGRLGIQILGDKLSESTQDSIESAASDSSEGSEGSNQDERPAKNKTLAEARETIRIQRDRLQQLRAKVEEKDRLLEEIASDDSVRWLYRNRVERMDATLPWFNQERAKFHLDRYYFASRLARGLDVADVACGTGYGTRILERLGEARSALGVDIDREAIAYAQEKHALVNGRFLCGSATELPIADSSLDLLVSFETIEHVPEEQQMLSEFFRVLKPGGLFVCSTPNQWPLAIAPYHVREYDLRSFTKALEPWFESLVFYNQNSGTKSPFNRGMPRGIIPLADRTSELGECIIVVGKRR